MFECIICGDFGGIWDKSGDSKKEAMILNQLECKSYTTLFVDGNHENFDRHVRLSGRHLEWR